MSMSGVPLEVLKSARCYERREELERHALADVMCCFMSPHLLWKHTGSEVLD